MTNSVKSAEHSEFSACLSKSDRDCAGREAAPCRGGRLARDQGGQVSQGEIERLSWKVKLAQPQVLGGGEVRGSAQAGGGSASSRHHRNHLLLKVSPLLLLIFNLLSHRLAAFGDTLLGKPKGVMLSHLNIVSATLACTHQLGQYAPNSQVGGH